MNNEIIKLLQMRVSIIANHAWRDRDGDAHLQALSEISAKISEWTQQHRTQVDAQLRHFLANASYQKALAHLEGLPANN